MPYTGIVLSITAAFLGAFLILLSHWLVAAGLFPQGVRKLADVYDRRPIRAALVGIFTYGPIQFLTLNAGRIAFGPLKFVVLVAGFGTLLIALAGTAGLALKVGRNLSEGVDTWRQVLRGGIMLALVFITPIVGWFFVLPVGLASGFGAFILSKPWKSAVKSTAEAVVVAEVPPNTVSEPTPSVSEPTPVAQPALS